MRNTIEKGRVSFLIIRIENDRYLGLCKEFGFIEEEETLEKAEKRLINSARLLLETVAKNPKFEASLNLGLPLKYEFLFYIVPFFTWLSSFIKRFKTNIRYFTDDISSLRHGQAFPQSCS